MWGTVRKEGDSPPLTGIWSETLPRTHANEKPCSVSEGTPPYLSPERPVAVVLGQEGKGVCPQPSILAWRSPMKGTHT